MSSSQTQRSSQVQTASLKQGPADKKINQSSKSSKIDLKREVQS